MICKSQGPSNKPNKTMASYECPKPSKCLSFFLLMLHLSLAFLFFEAAASSAMAAKAPAELGGQEAVNPNATEVVEAGKFAVEEYNKKAAAKLTLGHVVNGTQQVVNGMYYRLVNGMYYRLVIAAAAEEWSTLAEEWSTLALYKTEVWEKFTKGKVQRALELFEAFSTAG